MFQGIEPQGSAHLLTLGVLKMNFDQLAEEFSRLNPIDVHLLTRSLADPIIDNDVMISRLLSENKLVERFGEVAACSNVKKPEGWEQAILLVDRRSVLQQKAYANWLEVTNEATALCQSMGVRNFNCGHDQIIEFVRAIDTELPSQNKTEFVDLFKENKGFSFDSTKGLVTSIEDIPKKSARYCRSLIACESHVNVFPNDGLYEDSKLFVWGGRKFDSLTNGQVRVVKLLYERYKAGRPDVRISDICKNAKVQASGGFKQNVFKLRRSGWPNIHPVACIVVNSGQDTYRLIDPGKVPACS
jgi:hypothetical protein